MKIKEKDTPDLHFIVFKNDITCNNIDLDIFSDPFLQIYGKKCHTKIVEYWKEIFSDIDIR